MPGLILPHPFHKILVVGPLYDKIDKLSYLENKTSEYDWIIFNSGLCHSSNEDDQLNQRIIKMKDFIKKYKAIYLVGRSDYLMLAKTKNIELENWINISYNIVFLDFPTRNVVIVDGGIPITTTKRIELFNNLEVSFISRTKEKPWHDDYDGRMGYVISNNPLTNDYPKYYRHSMQLGNFNNSNNVYAVEIDEIGLKKTIML